MFTDELTIQARAGQGGSGSVHFARRKYQPFGGPDGGDGGNGGNVYLQGSRAVDSLFHLRRSVPAASDGEPGGGNLMIGATGKDAYIEVPPGTLAYDNQTGYELGAVLSSKDRLVLARGGKGGKGNPSFATGSKRAPKQAGTGTPGENISVLLRYRIYAETALMEPCAPLENTLLPTMLEREAYDVDWDLYRRKPRWVRMEHDFRRFDTAYIPFDLDVDGMSVISWPEHLYWARNIVINMLPVTENTSTAWECLADQLLEAEFRQLEQITVLSGSRLFDQYTFKAGDAKATAQCCLVDPLGLMEGFKGQLHGGTVE